MKTPLVSVVMPVYNAEKYVSDAIESILQQTFTDFELIVINDGSTDNSAKILKNYADQDNRIRFINHRKNKGLIGVLNEGLDICCGKYIARMDSDDISMPQRFEAQVAYMDAHPECGVLSVGFQMFGDSDKIVIHPAHVGIVDFMHGCLVAHPGVMMRKSVLDMYGFRYDKNYKYAEDYDLWSRMACVTQIHNLPDVLLQYRWHKSNVSVLHSAEQTRCTEAIRENIANVLFGSETDKNILYDMLNETTRRFYLFGFLPIVRRKQYATTKTKYYLFEKIPLIREQDGKIYLFGVIKLGVVK